MSNGDKTDPLARYTATGSRSSSIPANPYKAKGQNAYWNGQRWVPFSEPSTLPTVAKQQDKLPSGPGWFQRNIVQPVSTVAALPFSSTAQESVGTSVGNVISKVPVVRDVIASAPEAAVRYPSEFIKAGTGVGSLTQAGTELNKGNLPGFLSNIAFGGLQLYGAGSFGSGGTKLLEPAKYGGRLGPFGSIVEKPLRAAGGALFTGLIAAPGGPQVSATPTQPTSTSTISPDRYEELKRREQAQQSLDYLRTPQYDVTPYGATIKQTFTDPEGRVHNWNPRSKMYEVTGTVAAGTTGAGAGMNLGLTAAQQLEFENRLRDIEAETQAVLSGLGGQASSARSEAQQGREASRRSVAGGSQDLASSLAFLGLDTSPGVIDVGQEYQARAGAEREAAIAKSLAQTLGDISARRAEALRAQERNKRELAAARLQLEEENILKKQEEEFWKNTLGGGK